MTNLDGAAGSAPLSDGASPRTRVVVSALVGAGATLVLLAGMFPAWLRGMASGFPDPASQFLPWGADTRLVMWILSWGSHALATDPLLFFEGNVFHPAGHILAGSEHFLGVQAMFGPLYALTGNPVLSTNLVALSIYVGTAALMSALVASWGAGVVASSLAGVLAAVGAVRVPVGLHPTIQHPSVWLLALWLVYDRYFTHPDREGGTIWLGLVLLLAMLWSYYSAGLTLIMAMCLAADLCRRRDWRHLSRLIVMVSLCLVPLALVSIPYIDHALQQQSVSPAVAAGTSDSQRWLIVGYVARFLFVNVNWITLVLLAVGLPRVLSHRRAHPGVYLGLSLVTVGTLGAILLHLLVVEPRESVVTRMLALPLTFFRYRWRLIVLADVGAVALAGYGLHLILSSARWRAPARAMLICVVVGGILYRAAGLGAYPITPFPTATPPVYAWLAEHGEGRPVLEWPYPHPFPALSRDALHQSDAMLGSVFHWLPLLNGYTGYPPPWRRALFQIANGIQDPARLHDLVAATHVRWIVWRGAAGELPPFHQNPLVRSVAQFDGAVIYRVEVTAGANDVHDRLRRWDRQALGALRR